MLKRFSSLAPVVSRSARLVNSTIQVSTSSIAWKGGVSVTKRCSSQKIVLQKRLSEPGSFRKAKFL